MPCEISCSVRELQRDSSSPVLAVQQALAFPVVNRPQKRVAKWEAHNRSSSGGSKKAVSLLCVKHSLQKWKEAVDVCSLNLSRFFTAAF